MEAAAGGGGCKERQGSHGERCRSRWDQRNAGKGYILVVLDVEKGIMATVEGNQITEGVQNPSEGLLGCAWLCVAASSSDA